jgi:site-specific DNA-methyltransferase (adenine-specific)
MKPYYEQDGITIYHGDCREVLRSVPASAADLILTDPPYNVGIEYGDNTNDHQSASDYQGWCHSWFIECKRIAPTIALTPGIVNLRTWYAIEAASWVIAWHKPAAMGRSPFGFCNWEPVLVWGKSRGRSGVDVVTAGIVPDGEIDGHPCPKPIRWAAQLIALLAPLEGGLIVDPFAGSGTVLRAAKDAGFRAIGIEIEERYCEIAAKRLAQGVLFGAGGAA